MTNIDPRSESARPTVGEWDFFKDMGNYVGFIANGLSEKANDFISKCPVWAECLNIIRRGREREDDGDLSLANDKLLPYLIEYGIWDGDKGEPIDTGLANELWHYIKIITERPKEF